MDQHYHHISALERNFLQHQLNLGRNQAKIAMSLGRSRSTISREMRRNSAQHHRVPVPGRIMTLALLAKHLMPAAEEGLCALLKARLCVRLSSHR